jgi:AcrR family transcriptional regulator
MSRRGTRRQDLVEAAYRRVAEVGFEGLRLRHVAGDIGIDHSTLHHHVPTKHDLIVGIAEYATSRFWSTMPDGPDPAARLRGHLRALRGLMEEQPELFTVTVELDLRARRDPTVRAAMQRYESGWRQVLVEVLSAGTRSGALAAVADVEALAELVIAAVKGVRLDPYLAPAVFDELEAVLLRTAPAPTDMEALS